MDARRLLEIMGGVLVRGNGVGDVEKDAAVAEAVAAVAAAAAAAW